MAKLWVGDKMYLVDDEVRDYVDALEAQLEAAKKLERDRWESAKVLKEANND